MFHCFGGKLYPDPFTGIYNMYDLYTSETLLEMGFTRNQISKIENKIINKQFMHWKWCFDMGLMESAEIILAER